MASVSFRRINVGDIGVFYREAGSSSAPTKIARRISNAGTAPCDGRTPTEIADEMEAWYGAGAADGFNLMFPLLPDDWLNFAELVVPVL
jgi:alkanesulfonate monooxygenase SsuD/methylene tetrahydromethanopterin reductase-like flavin-dependent oxidoreductase (luciferase family)